MTGFERLNEAVIQAGLCTDCGTCAAVCPTRAIGMNYETEEPELVGQCAPHCSICSDTCAGKDIDIPGLNRVSFGRDASPDEALLGVTQGYLKAYAADSAVRDAGAAGGVVSALLIYALEANIIDGAIVTGMSETQPWRVVPGIATTREEVLATAQSRYAIVPTNAIIKEALGRGLKRLGAVGLPCHIHGLRKIQAAGMPKQTPITS
jgi:coenzyme F420 hydrogenase subunit beta